MFANQRRHKELIVVITMTVLFLFLTVFLFFYLPVRIGIVGGHDGVAGELWGWVRPWGGALGIQIRLADGVLWAAVMVGGWAPLGHTFSTDRRPAKPAPGKRKKGKKKKGREEDEKEAKRKGERPPGQRLQKMVATAERVWFYVRALKPSVRRFFSRLRRGFRLRHLVCRAVFGTGNPATTGRVYGYALAASHVIGRRFQMHIAPDFTRVRLEGEATLEVSVYLYRLLWAVVCLAVRGAWVWGRDACRQWRRGRAAAKANATGSVAD